MTNASSSQISDNWYDKQTQALNKASGEVDNMDYNVSNTSFAMIVIVLMDKVGMGPIEKVMSAESQLEDTLAKVQGSLVTISSFLSKLENNSASTNKVWQFDHWGNGANRTEYDGSNSFNGLDPEFYNSNEFKGQIQTFLSTFKQLFYSGNGNTGMTVKDISSITGMDGKSHDLSSYWKDLAGKFQAGDVNDPNHPNSTKSFSYTDKDGKHSIIEAPNGSNGNTSVSLYQMYVYTRLKLEMLNTSQTKMSAPGWSPKDAFFPDPSADKGASNDGICSTLNQFLTSFNTSVHVKRDNGWGTGSRSMYESTTAGGDPDGNSILGLMQQGILDDTNGPTGPTQGWGGKIPGLKTALSYMAFNYFWTKNPSASNEDLLYDHPADPTGGGTWNGWLQVDHRGIAQGDLLSDTYGSSTNVQSLVGSHSQEETTDMQAKTSEMGQFDNIGQQVVQQYAKANDVSIQGFRAG